jgi:hypothetical protein
MNAHVSAILLGVSDMEQSKRFGSANKWWVKRREVAGGGDLANTAPSPR